MVSNPTAATNETPANVAPDEARLPSTIADLTLVPNAATPSGPSAIVATLLEFGFTFASGEASLPVDELIDHLLIGSLRQLAAYFGIPTPEQNKKSFCLESIS